MTAHTHAAAHLEEPAPSPAVAGTDRAAARRGGAPSRPPVGPAGRRPAGGGDRRPHRSGSCELRTFVRGFMQLYLEVEVGRRPVRQAARLLDPELAARLEGVWVRAVGALPGRVVALTGGRVTADRCEAVAVVDRHGRRGAIAVQLRRKGGRWIVTDVVRPEDGPLPAPPFAFPSPKKGGGRDPR